MLFASTELLRTSELRCGLGDGTPGLVSLPRKSSFGDDTDTL